MNPAEPPLGWKSLVAAYSWLPAAAWVFDRERMRIAWANAAALSLWRAESLEELQARDLSDGSAASVERMQALVQSPVPGDGAPKDWTLWPRGIPVRVRMTRTLVALEDGRTGILAYAIPLEALSGQRAIAEKRLLEMVSTGEPLERVLHLLVREIEALSSGLLCSVLLLDGEGRLRAAAAPSLPAQYNAAIDGLAIGPAVGSCGTAAWRGELVIVSDIAADPLWAEYRAAALSNGLRACWSIPINSSAGKVLGTFAAYYREPREPDRAHLELLETARHIAGIAIERARTQAALEKQHGELQTALDSLPAMICYADTGMRFVHANRPYAEWLGCEREALRGRHIREIVGEEAFATMLPYLDQVLAGREVRYERRQRGHDGVPRDFEVHYVPHRDGSGAVCGYFVMLTDVTERKKDEALLHFLANHDQLTSLPNRTLFNEHLTLAVAHAERCGEKLAALFIDLDRFKNVNDSLGHESGDLLLQQVARRFRARLRESDVVARLGGDEYTVLLRSVQGSEDVSACAQKLLDALAEPFEVHGHELYVTCSIGISLFPDDARDPASLLKNADIAMYRAKDQGKNAYQFYSSEVTAARFEHLMLETSLRRALERAEFVLHYQPIVELRTLRVAGMETLLRWQHPDHGMVSPARFIPLAEETGLILPIGQWVLEQACLQARKFAAAGHPDLVVSVNLSPKQFRQPDLSRSVARALEAAGLPPDKLTLEVTEGSVMDNADVAVRTLHELKAMGIGISIDDFGTGYSSLSYLKRFPIDSLKIDQSFVRDITTDPDDAAITSAVVALGHSLRLNIVAEGVETEEQLQFLRDLDCHAAQGYLFGRPAAADAFAQALASSPLRPAA
jgi:diguanylate cyclase (GGDEF)-like protein/PAS domain S-box-containing protein